MGNGSGGEPVVNNGKKFKDEKAGLLLSHAAAGVLSMGNSGKNSNSSQFFFALGPALSCDKKHVVFGRVASGLEVLRQIEAVASAGHQGGGGGGGGGKPSVDVTVTCCGAWVPGVDAGQGYWLDVPDKDAFGGSVPGSFGGSVPRFFARPRVGIVCPAAAASPPSTPPSSLADAAAPQPSAAVVGRFASALRAAYSGEGSRGGAADATELVVGGGGVSARSSSEPAVVASDGRGSCVHVACGQAPSSKTEPEKSSEGHEKSSGPSAAQEPEPPKAPLDPSSASHRSDSIGTDPRTATTLPLHWSSDPGVAVDVVVVAPACAGGSLVLGECGDEKRPRVQSIAASPLGGLAVVAKPTVPALEPLLGPASPLRTAAGSSTSGWGKDCCFD